MRKTEVYSWRMSPELKAALEDAARREGSPLAELLERIASGWLAGNRPDASDEAAQQRLHAAARACFGSIRGGDAARSERVRERVRDRLRRQRR